VEESPTAIYTELAADLIPGVVEAYSHALRIVYVIGVPVAGLALFTAMFIKNIRIVRTPPAGAAPPPEAAETVPVVISEKDVEKNADA